MKNHFLKHFKKINKMLEPPNKRPSSISHANISPKLDASNHEYITGMEMDPAFHSWLPKYLSIY